MKEQPFFSGAFLQSDDWATFQNAVGARMTQVAGVNLFFVPLPFGLHYGYAPRAELSDTTLNAIIHAAKKEHAVFLRAEPTVQLVGNHRFRKVRDNQPSVTRALDLSLSEEALLAQMKPKTRYNIRVAMRHGVVVQEARGVWGVRKFLKLLTKTKDRQQFTVHAPEYYEKMLEVLGGGETVDAERCEARLFVARYNGKVRAANIIISHGDTITYLHGASSEKDREIMAPYLLHWITMLWAKKHGFRWYDLWGSLTGRASVGPGVAPEGASGHPLASVSRFKEGFGGGVFAYPGTFEIPFRRFWYFLIRLHRRARHIV